MLIEYFFVYVPLDILVFKWKLNITKMSLIRDFWNAGNVFKMPKQPSTIQSVNKTALGVLGYLCTSEASLSAATDLGFRDKESMDDGP